MAPTRSYGVVGKNVNKVFQQICLNIERILSLYRGGLGTESRAVLGNWGGERKGGEFPWQRWCWAQMEQACIFPREAWRVESRSEGEGQSGFCEGSLCWISVLCKSVTCCTSLCTFQKTQDPLKYVAAVIPDFTWKQTFVSPFSLCIQKFIDLLLLPVMLSPFKAWVGLFQILFLILESHMERNYFLLLASKARRWWLLIILKVKLLIHNSYTVLPLMRQHVNSLSKTGYYLPD